MYYSYKGETEKAIEHLNQFTNQSNYHYWTVLFTAIDPLTDNIKDLSEYKRVFKKIENNFNTYHNQLENSLKNKGLL